MVKTMAKNKKRKSIRNKRMELTKKIARHAANSHLGYLIARTNALKNRFRLALIISVLINIGLIFGIAYAYTTIVLLKH